MEPHGKYCLGNPTVTFDPDIDLWVMSDDDGYVVDWYVTREEANAALADVLEAA